MAKNQKKKGGKIFIILPILLILVGGGMVAKPFLDDYFIEQEQSDVISVLEQFAELQRPVNSQSAAPRSEETQAASSDESAPPSEEGTSAPKAEASVSGDTSEQSASGEQATGETATESASDAPENRGEEAEGTAAPDEDAAAATTPSDSGTEAADAEAPGKAQLAAGESDSVVAMREMVKDNPSIHVADNGAVYVDMEINTDEEIGYDAFMDPNTGEAVESMPDLGAQVPGTLRVEILGRVYIPKIDCYYFIVDGSGRTELKYSVGHWRSSAYIGEVGNMVLPGHRNYTYGKFFNRLDEIEEGDLVEVYDMQDNKYVYEIDRVIIVKPEDLYGVLVVNEGEELDRRVTLSTCHPVVVADHRLCVQGKLIEGPEWTLEDNTPLDPFRVDEETQLAKLDQLLPYRQRQLLAQALPGLKRVCAIDQEPMAVEVETTGT